MSVVASDILFVRGDGGYRPGLTSPVASLDLVKQTGDPHHTNAVNTTTKSGSAVFGEYHHSPRWLSKNEHNNQKTAKYKQLFSARSAAVPPGSSRVTSVTPVSGPAPAAGQAGSAARRPPLPAARSSLSSITSLILGANRFRQRSAKANHKSTTVLNKTEDTVDHTTTTIITTGDSSSAERRTKPSLDYRATAKEDRRTATWIERALHTDNTPLSQAPPPPRTASQSQPAQQPGDVTRSRDEVTGDVRERAAGAARPPRSTRVSLVAVSAAGEGAVSARHSDPARGGHSAACVRVTGAPERGEQPLPVAPPRRRRPSGRLACSVGDLLDSGERRPRLQPLEAAHRVPSATTRLTIPLTGVRGAPDRDPGLPPSGANPSPAHSRLETRLDSSHDSSVRSHDSTSDTAPRPRPRRHSKSTGSLLFARETPGSPPRAAPRSLKFSIGRPLTEHGARTSVQLTSVSVPQRQTQQEPKQEPERIQELRSERRVPIELEQEPEKSQESESGNTLESDGGDPVVIRRHSPPRQPLSFPPAAYSREREADSSSADGSESPPSARRFLSPLSADSVSNLAAADSSAERRTYRSRVPRGGASATASPATPLFTSTSADRRRPQSAFNARRTIAHRRQAEAASRSASEPRRKHTATWVTGKINVSVTSVGRAASLTQLGAGGVSRILTVSDRSSSSPTLEQEKRDIRRYLYSSNLTEGSESPERERRLSESCLRLGAPPTADELAQRPSDRLLLSPDSIGSCWSAVTADVLTVRDTTDERPELPEKTSATRANRTGAWVRTDNAMAGAVEMEVERPPSVVSTAASTASVPRRRISTSVVHLWGNDESHILPSGPSSLPVPNAKPARPHSLSTSTLMADSDRSQPSWLTNGAERRSLRDGRPSWHRAAKKAPLKATEDQAAERRLIADSSLPQPAVGLAVKPVSIDLTSKSAVELSSEVPPEPPSCPPPDSPTDIPPPPPSQPPPDSPTDSPPPLPSVPPPESPTDSGPEPLWTSRFERPRRQSLSTSLPSFATVPLVSDGSASVGRKTPSMTPSLWSDAPAARRPLRPAPAGLASDTGRGPFSLPPVPASGSGGGADTTDCTVDWRSGAGRAGDGALPSGGHTVQVRVERTDRATEPAAAQQATHQTPQQASQQRRASTGVYLNGAPPGEESRTKTSFTISLGGPRKRPSLLSQRSSPSLLSSSQPSSLPTLSTKSPNSPPPAKQPLSLSGLRRATEHRPLSMPAAPLSTTTTANAQPTSLPSVFGDRKLEVSTPREPISLPSVPPPPLPKTPPPVRRPSPPLRSSLRSPPPSRSSPPRSPAAARTTDTRRGSSELQRQLEDDWARMERRHQAFLRHTAQQRGQPAPRSILKKQSAPSLLESVACETHTSWTRDTTEQPRRRASNVNWHDLERTKQQIRAEIERMKRQLRTDMGGVGSMSGTRAGPWPPPRPAGASTTSSATSSSRRTVVETIHAIHVERDSSPGLVITEMHDDDGDDAASNHSGVVIEEIVDDDEPDSAPPAGRPTSPPASSEPRPPPEPAPWWRAGADQPSEPAASQAPSLRRPTELTATNSATEGRISQSAVTSSVAEERTVAGEGDSLSDRLQQHVQMEELSAASVTEGEHQDLSMTHYRHLYVDKRKTVHIATADGDSLEWRPTETGVSTSPTETAVSTTPPDASLEAPSTPTVGTDLAPSDPPRGLEVAPPSPSLGAEPALPASPVGTELNRPEEEERDRRENVIQEVGNKVVESPSSLVSESCQSSTLEAQEVRRQSAVEPESSSAMPDASCRLSGRPDQLLSEPLATGDRSESLSQLVEETQSVNRETDEKQTTDPLPSKETVSEQPRRMMRDPPNSPRETTQSPQSRQHPSGRPPPSTFGSWKARHAARLLASDQPSQSSGTAVGRSVEAALSRLLADASRTDRGTQATQSTERVRSGVSAGGGVSQQRQPTVDRGVTPPRQRPTVDRGVTPPRQRPAVPRQGTPVRQQGTPTRRQETTAPRVVSASRGTDQRTSEARSRTAGTSGRTEKGGEGERRQNRARTESGDSVKRTNRTNEPAPTQKSGRRDRTDSYNSDRGSQTEKTKSKSQTKSPLVTERVQNSRLIISHKLNASSPHFYTEMKWNEKEKSRSHRVNPSTDGDATAPDETRHYHTVDVDGDTITSRLVTRGGDLSATFRTSSGVTTDSRRGSSDTGGQRPASPGPRRSGHLPNLSRPSKSAHGCSITVQEFIV